MGTTQHEPPENMLSERNQMQRVTYCMLASRNICNRPSYRNWRVDQWLGARE